MAATDASSKVPYVTAYGNITKVLGKIKTAAVPSRFTQDFLATKLGLSGGGARPVLPYLKRAGFLASDGSPTTIYQEFRNPTKGGSAAARAMKTAYAALYELNEYIQDASEGVLKGAIVQATGIDAESSTIKSMLGSFKALKAFAIFGDDDDSEPEPQDEVVSVSNQAQVHDIQSRGQSPELRLAYSINLQLPNTADIAVFNAIFKSLREHLID